MITEAGTDPVVASLVYIAPHMRDRGETEAEDGRRSRSQALNAAVNFQAVISNPAWRTKPSWMLVAGADRVINPELERWYATRARSRKVEVAGASHAVYASQPEDVASIIADPATHALASNP